jgi:thiol:disulfide interchange protein
MYRLLLAACLVASTPFFAHAQFGVAGPKVAWQPITETQPQPAGSTVRAGITVTIEEGWHVHSNKPFDEYLIPTELKLEDLPGLRILRIAYPKHEIYHLAVQPDEELAVFPRVFTIGVEIQIAPDAAPGPATLNGTLRYQACDDKQCVAPKTIPITLPLQIAPPNTTATVNTDARTALDALLWNAAEGPAAAPSQTPPPSPEAAIPANGDWKSLAAKFNVAGAIQYANARDFLAWIRATESGENNDGFEGQGWLVILLAVLMGGLGLNLTPCVLPLIPINIAIIGAGARAGSKLRGFALGAAYGTGIALVYGALGLVVVLGFSNTFGAINGTVWFNATITFLFVLLGLAMFDLINIDFSRFQASLGIRRNEKGSFAVALFMGGVSALLAGACVAPVLITTLLYAQDQYQKGASAALALPFLLGLGMALPWPFAGAGLSFLPKPGGWMTRVKQAFGLFILLLAAYYAHTAWSILSNRMADPDEVRASVAASDEDGWMHDLPAALARADAEKKPLLIDFWATWCKNCLVMNKTTLKDPAVLAALEGYIKIKYQAEDVADPATAAVLEHFGVLGLPTYIILQPR